MSGYLLLVGRKSMVGMTLSAATGADAGIGRGGYAYDGKDLMQGLSV